MPRCETFVIDLELLLMTLGYTSCIRSATKPFVLLRRLATMTMASSTPRPENKEAPPSSPKQVHHITVCKLLEQSQSATRQCRPFFSSFERTGNLWWKTTPCLPCVCIQILRATTRTTRLFLSCRSIKKVEEAFPTICKDQTKGSNCSPHI
jgi:hypothetical protein